MAEEAARGAGRRRLLGAIVAALALLAALGLGEVVVRLLEKRGRLGGGSVPRYEEAYQALAFRKTGLGPGGFLAEGFRGFASDELGRPVEWVNNRSGFRRRTEIAGEPPPGVLRILWLGDSFVAGHRVGQEETFGWLVEEALRRRGIARNVEVLLSAIEEPATGLDYLQTRGHRFRPHLVLVGLTLGNDLAQVYFNLAPRGAYRLGRAPGPPLESNPAVDGDVNLAALRAQRIPADYLTPDRPPTAFGAPRSERALHLLARIEDALAERGERNAAQAILSTWGEYRHPLLFDGNGLGFCLKPPPGEIVRGYHRLFALLEGYRRICRERGIALAVTVFPQRFQVQPEDLRATLEAYGLLADRFDARLPNRRIAAFCRRSGIRCVDATDALSGRHAATRRSLYMPRGDMHWNRLGNRAYAEAVEAELARLAERALRARSGDPARRGPG